MKNGRMSPKLGLLAMCVALLVLLVVITRVAHASPGGDTDRGRAPHAAAPGQVLPMVVVHKNPGCECCELWAMHLRRSGFKVQVVESRDLGAFKARVGVPAGKGSCHTAQAGGLFVEGHVPADAIKAALATHAVRGLVLPGMPGGAPGMPEPPGGTRAFTAEWVDAHGATRPFRTYTP